MDDRRFDEISRYLGTSLSRQSVFRYLAGLGAAGVAALGGSELLEARKRKKKRNNRNKKRDNDNDKDRDKEKDKENNLAEAERKNKKRKKGKKGRKGKKNKKRANAQAPQTCEEQEKVAYCQCPPGNPNNQHVICGAADSCSGHLNQCDCICGDTAVPGCAVPLCGPGVCEGEFSGAGCPHCAGVCEDDDDCQDLPNCACVKAAGAATGLCGAPPVTTTTQAATTTTAQQTTTTAQQTTTTAEQTTTTAEQTTTTAEQTTTTAQQTTTTAQQTTTTAEQTTTTPAGTTTTAPVICEGPCSVTDPCPNLTNCLCELDDAGPTGTCVTCPANRITCGPVCCPNGQICADAATGTCAVPGCVPDPIEQACAGLQCGPASNGCGQDYDCGTCGRKKSKKKGRRGRKQICVTGVCRATGKKRCIGSGLAGQPCGGKKCKCEGDRRCNKGRCCETRGDGTQHCQANNDCCPGLVCARRRPGQHKVCIRRNAKGEADFTGIEETSAPSLAIGALLTGLALKGGERWFGSAGTNAPIALDELRKEGERTEA